MMVMNDDGVDDDDDDDHDGDDDHDDDGDEVMMPCDCMLDTCYSNVTVSSPGMPTNRLNAVPYAHDSDAVQIL